MFRDNEAAMIQEIATDVSNKLINFAPSRDLDSLVGMKAHMEKMKPLLCLDSNEVRMIGIWDLSGIDTIQDLVSMNTAPRPTAITERVLISNNQPRRCQYFSFRSCQDRLKDKKVLVVLDDVDQSAQLDALAKVPSWFGPGSRIIVTTQDKKILNAHGINRIYKVDFQHFREALEIFCMNAFGQNSIYDGFQDLACEVTYLAGNLPLGLRVMGSYFKGMHKEWEEELPRLRTSLTEK
ncbi:hypothetical protein DY000_02009612 [Brassica cretica]|uniref:NB-ARC domain-containing protein n=1 Tax=Brassica cretica TaxID=69181 RepID=A0ABQ7CDZ4_BRACR|nr:hypothetical protein DY000_02009612 [Brassica cretica]